MSLSELVSSFIFAPYATICSHVQGPAHAVYFATYEAVKHAMGGNQVGVHHPLAAGKSPPI